MHWLNSSKQLDPHNKRDPRSLAFHFHDVIREEQVYSSICRHAFVLQNNARDERKRRTTTGDNVHPRVLHTALSLASSLAENVIIGSGGAFGIHLRSIGRANSSRYLSFNNIIFHPIFIHLTRNENIKCHFCNDQQNLNRGRTLYQKITKKNNIKIPRKNNTQAPQN